MEIFSHEWMVNDPVRVNAYRRAIAKVVRPGDVVAEIGAGTGILSCFACRAGASRVYAVESREIGHLAAQIAEANGFGDRIEVVMGVSTEVNLPRKADVIVSEILGSWALDENILGYTINARDRWLKKGGRLLPDLLELWFVPSESDHYEKKIRLWARGRYGLNLRPVGESLALTYQPALLDPESFLSQPRALSAIDLREVGSRRHEARGLFQALRDGTMRGVGSWFRARLAPRIWLSTAPDAKPTCWQQVFFPLEPPVRVRKGDLIEISVGAFSADKHGVDTSWEVRIGKEGKAYRAVRRASTLSLGRWYPPAGIAEGNGAKKKPSGKARASARKIPRGHPKPRGRRMRGFPVRRPDIVRKRVDEEVLLFDTQSQQAHFINQTAELIWDLCDGKHNEEDIAKEISSKYDMDMGRVLGDVRILLSEFEEKQLFQQ